MNVQERLRGQTPLHLLINKISELMDPSIQRNEAEILALSQSYKKIFLNLLDAGASLYVYNKEDRLPLDYLPETLFEPFFSSWNEMEIFQLLSVFSTILQLEQNQKKLKKTHRLILWLNKHVYTRQQVPSLASQCLPILSAKIAKKPERYAYLTDYLKVLLKWSVSCYNAPLEDQKKEKPEQPESYVSLRDLLNKPSGSGYSSPLEDQQKEKPELIHNRVREIEISPNLSPQVLKKQPKSYVPLRDLLNKPSGSDYGSPLEDQKKEKPEPIQQKTRKLGTFSIV